MADQAGPSNQSGPPPPYGNNQNANNVDMEDGETSDEENDDVAHLRRQITTQGQQITVLMDNLAQAMAQIVTLNRAAPTQQGPPAGPRASKPKMRAPERYNGTPEGLGPFLTDMDLFCQYNEIPNDQEKILMAGMHLGDKAAQWMQAFKQDYLRDIPRRGTQAVTQHMFASWNNFVQAMEQNFGVVDEQKQAEKMLWQLKQTKSVTEYTAKFKEYQVRVDWGDAALKSCYEAGLKESVKDALVYGEDPNTLDELIQVATKLDRRLWDRAMKKKEVRVHQPNTGRRQQFSVRKDHSGDVIMTGKVNEKPWKGKGRNTNKGPSKEERQRRFAEKLCLRCGKPGHFKDKCEESEPTVKQGTVVVGMVRPRTPYPQEVTDSEEEISDLDLYEEARKEIPNDLQDRAVKIPKPIKKDSVLQLPCQCAEEGKQGTGWRMHEFNSEVEDCHQENCLDHRQNPHQLSKNTNGVIQKLREHGGLHWTACYNDECLIHLSGKQNGYWPRRRNCANKQLKRDDWHADLPPQACEISGCEIHQEKTKYRDTRSARAQRLDYLIKISRDNNEIQDLRKQRQDSHQGIQWMRCFNNDCETHLEGKLRGGYFPQRPLLGRRKTSKN